MDYTNHKLPVTTGAGLFAVSIVMQLWILLGVLVALIVIATLIRKFWRRDK